MSKINCWLGTHNDETVGINDRTYATVMSSGAKEWHEMRFYQCKTCGRRRFYASIDLKYRSHVGVKAAKKNWLECGVVPADGTWSFKGNGNTAGYVAPDYLAEVVDNQILLTKQLELINQRLAILEPDHKKMKRFPALKAAYEQYKITEGLTYSDKD